MAGNNEDPAWTLLLVIGVAGFIFFLIWWEFKDQILFVFRYLRLIELGIVSLFDRDAAACFTWLRQAPSPGEPLTREAGLAAVHCFGAEFLQNLPRGEAPSYYFFTTTSLGAVTSIPMRYFRWLVLFLALGGSYIALFISKRDKFKTRHNLESFIRLQAGMWPVIKPIVDFIPAKHSARIPGQMVPDKMPPFAEALSPEEWLSFHRIPVTGGIPDREQVRRAFLLQLGPRWTGAYEGLPPYILGLLAAFALKGVQKREESDDFLGRLSLCWTARGGFKPTADVMAEIKKALKDPNIGGKALEVAAKHAYRTTAICGVLRYARFMGGVLAAAQFLWLRGVDRDLWYALNNLGRRSFHSEGAGAMAHYMAEDAAGKALPVPRLETAIVTINQYLAANQPTIPPREGPKKARA